MQRLWIASLMIISFAFSQEPSAFNAGGTAPQKTETQIINEKLFNLSTQIKGIEESQEGLKSVFEGQLQRVQEVVGNVDTLKNEIEALKGQNDATIIEIRNHVDSNFALQNENIEKIKESISALGVLIQKINAQMQTDINNLKEHIAALDGLPKVSQSQKKGDNESTLEVVSATKDEEQNSANPLFSETEDVLVIENHTDAMEIQNTPPLEEIEDDVALVADNINNVSFEEKEEVPQQKELEQSIKQNEASIEKVEPIPIASDFTQNSQALKSQENLEVKANVKKEEKQKETSLNNKPLANVFQEGEQFYKDKNYQKADEYLQFAIKGSYRPARGNYLLGEIAFEQKRYEDAIYYYKISATRYDKADYMPRLMLNSAKSFVALKEQDHAKRFLETLIALYPQSSEAKEAKELIR